jgi:hypothetical protein
LAAAYSGAQFCAHGWTCVQNSTVSLNDRVAISPLGEN